MYQLPQPSVNPELLYQQENLHHSSSDGSKTKKHTNRSYPEAPQPLENSEHDMNMTSTYYNDLGFAGNVAGSSERNTSGGSGKDIESGTDNVYEDYMFKQNKKVQMTFLTKVYTILTIQLLVTAALISLNLFIPQLRMFNFQYYYVSLVLLLSSLLLLFVLFIFQNRFPWNFILLTVWTLMFGWAIGMVSSIYYVYEVLLAVGITILVTISLTAFVLISKAKLHFLGLALGIGLLVLISASFITLLLSLFLEIGVWWRFALAGFGALLFSLFILYDTSRILHSFKRDQVIAASITLYVDIINLFLYILQLIGLSRR